MKFVLSTVQLCQLTPELAFAFGYFLGNINLNNNVKIAAFSRDSGQAAFAQTKIDHVVMGAGIDLETRLQIVREIFQASDTTTVHMKDRASGPEGFLPFIRSVLRGLDDQPS